MRCSCQITAAYETALIRMTQPVAAGAAAEGADHQAGQGRADDAGEC